jgi:nicotinamidase-related amidase
MSAKNALNGLDPARTALVVVHMVKGVAGEVDTPFNRLFRQRAEQTGTIKAQLRLLDAFRSAKARVLYTAVTYQPGLPGVSPNFPQPVNGHAARKQAEFVAGPRRTDAYTDRREQISCSPLHPRHRRR